MKINKKIVISMLIMIFCLGISSFCYAVGYISQSDTYTGDSFTATVQNTGGKNSEITLRDKSGNVISISDAVQILYDECYDGMDYNVQEAFDDLMDIPNYYLAITYGDKSYIVCDNERAQIHSAGKYDTDSSFFMQAMDDEMYEALSDENHPDHEEYTKMLFQNDKVDVYSPEDTDNPRGRLIYFSNEYIDNPNQAVYLHFGFNLGDRGVATMKVPLHVDVSNTNSVFETITGFNPEEVQDLRDEGKTNTYGESMFQKLEHGLSGIVRGLANLMYNIIMQGIKAVGGDTSELITIDHLVFDEFGDTSLWAFYDNTNTTSLVNKFKNATAKWYNNFQGIAFVVYIVLLLYIGIRILISVGGKQQSKYKEMLIGWGQGLILLIVFPVAIKYCIQLNHSLVELIKNSRTEAFKSISVNADANKKMKPKIPSVPELTGDNGAEIGKSMTSNPFAGYAESNYMAYMACQAEDSKSLVDATVYCIMVFQFIILLIAYYKRLMNFAFLMAIFPFVMIMYPIDKVGDGRAQSFSTWATEMMMNIFMQIFHAIVYVFVIGVVYSAQMEGTWLLAIVGISFLFKGEELLRQILSPGEAQTAPTLKQNAGKTIAAVSIVGTLTDKITDNVGHATSAVRFARKARAEKNYANALQKLNGSGTTGSSSGTTDVTTPSGSAGTIDINTPPRPKHNIDMPVRIAADRALAGTGIDSEKVLDAVDTLKGVKNQKDPKKIADALKTLQTAVGVNNPAINKLLQGSGLSGAQVNKLSELQADAMALALKGDKSDGNYSKTLEEINKFLEVKLSAIFPNLSVRDKKVFKHAMIINMANRDAISLGDSSGDPALEAFSKSFLKRKSGIIKEVQQTRANAYGFLDVGDVSQRFQDEPSKLFAMSKKPIKFDRSTKDQIEIMKAEMSGRVYLDSSGKAITQREADDIKRKGGTVATRIGRYKEQTKDWSDDRKEKLAEGVVVSRILSRRSKGDTSAPALTASQYSGALEGLAQLETNDSYGKDSSNIIKEELGVTGAEGLELFDNLIGEVATYTGPNSTESTKLKVGRRQFRKVLEGAVSETAPKTKTQKVIKKVTEGVKDYAEVEHADSDLEKIVQHVFNTEAFEGDNPTEEIHEATEETRNVYKKSMVRIMKRDKANKIKSARGIDRLDPLSKPFEYYDDATARTSVSQVLYNDREGISDATYARYMANERRDMVATVMEDLQTGAMVEDSGYIGSSIENGDFVENAPTLNGMTADEHKAKAAQYRRRFFEEAARTVTTSSSSIIGGTIGAPLAVGIGAEDSMIKEALTGALAGAVAGDTVAEKTFGEQKSMAKLRVRNPYDGTISEIELQRTGFDANPLGVVGESAINRIDPDKVYEISDLPRLLPESTRLNVDAQLADSARKRRRKIEDEEAKNRANVYRENLLSSKKQNK